MIHSFLEYKSASNLIEILCHLIIQEHIAEYIILDALMMLENQLSGARGDTIFTVILSRNHKIPSFFNSKTD